MAPPSDKKSLHATCETDSEDDHSSTPRPDVSRRKSHSSSSSATARRDSKVGSRRPEDKNSDSGYSTGTKGSADTGHTGRSAVDKTESAQTPVASPSKSSRTTPTKEKRLSSSKSQTSQRSSTKSAPAPSRAPSTKSRSSATSDKKKEEKRHSRHSDHAAPASALHSGVGTSPTSSRSSRTHSSSSHEMPPPASTVHSRPRSYSQSRPHRPASYHAGMGPIEAMYPPTFYEARGPPPSRSAYVDKHLVRPGLVILPPTPTYTPTMSHQALQPSMYDPSRMAIRAQTDYSPASGGVQYSARRQNVVYPDQPASYDPTAMLPPSPPSRSRSRQRAPVNPRKPQETPVFDDDSEPEYASEDDYDSPGAQYIPIRRPSVQEKRSSWGPRGARGGMYTPYGTSPYGTSPYGPSPYGTSPAAEFPVYDTRYDDAYAAQVDYRPSARSNTITSSSRSRYPSVASSGGGTRGTSYSQSSGSGTLTSSRQRSLYEHPHGNMPLDLTAQAEMYMKATDRSAQHVRHQQPPQLTQESLRLASARAIDGKRSSKGGAPPSVVSSSYASLRSRTVTAGDDQTVKVIINATAGLDLALEGDTEGRPIRLVQKPGEETAQLYIGTGPGRREETVYGDNSKSSGRSRVASKSGSSKAAVSGRRGRSRTMVE